MVALNQVLDKELLSPPGDTILETIEAIGVSKNELAKRLEQPEAWVNELITGEIKITSEIAAQLENALGIPVSFWLAREKEYRANLAQIEAQG